MTASRLLFIIGTVPPIVLGGFHAVAAALDAVRPRVFRPLDDSVRRSMERSGIALTRRIPVSHTRNLWRAWLGFNISHGLGVFLFGLVFLLLAVRDFQVIRTEPVFMLLPIAVTLVYLVLSIRFWFWAPTVGIGISAVCFILSAVLA